jgi:hypothetical protein
MLKSAINEPAVVENGLRKGTTNECAIVELTRGELGLLQVRLFEDLTGVMSLRLNYEAQVHTLLLCPIFYDFQV